MILYYQTKFDSKKISSSTDTAEIVIFWSYELPSTLTLKIGNQSFSMTLWLIMMYHKTKFRNKMLGGLEGIIWTNNILTLRYDLYPECSNPFFFHRELWLMMTYHQTKSGCQVINSLENVVAVVVARNSVSQIPTFLIHSTLFFQILSLLLPAFGMANSFSPHGPAKQNRSCCSQSTVKSDWCRFLCWEPMEYKQALKYVLECVHSNSESGVYL